MNNNYDITIPNNPPTVGICPYHVIGGAAMGQQVHTQGYRISNSETFFGTPLTHSTLLVSHATIRKRINPKKGSRQGKSLCAGISGWGATMDSWS
jgi:hypothetical protein